MCMCMHACHSVHVQYVNASVYVCMHAHMLVFISDCMCVHAGISMRALV